MNCLLQSSRRVMVVECYRIVQVKSPWYPIQVIPKRVAPRFSIIQYVARFNDQQTKNIFLVFPCSIIRPITSTSLSSSLYDTNRCLPQYSLINILLSYRSAWNNPDYISSGSWRRCAKCSFCSLSDCRNGLSAFSRRRTLSTVPFEFIHAANHRCLTFNSAQASTFIAPSGFFL